MAFLANVVSMQFNNEERGSDNEETSDLAVKIDKYQFCEAVLQGAGIKEIIEDFTKDMEIMDHKDELGIRNGLLLASFRKDKKDLYHVWRLRQMRTAVPFRWKRKHAYMLIPLRKQLVRRSLTP